MANQISVGKELVDDRSHSDQDVAAYAQAVASGAKFVERDSHRRPAVEEAEQQLDSPYAMSLEKKEVDRLKKLSLEEKTTTVVQDEA